MDYMNGMVLLQQELTRKARPAGATQRQSPSPLWRWLTRRRAD